MIGPTYGRGDRFRSHSPMQRSRTRSPQPRRNEVPTAEGSSRFLEANPTTFSSRSSSPAYPVPAPSVSPTPSAMFASYHAQYNGQTTINNNSNVNHNAPGGTIINNNSVTQYISRDQAAEDLDMIEKALGHHHVSRAPYDAQPLTAGCMHGTRVELLENTQNLLATRGGAHIVWIAGMAGTGKTSIALTLCRMLVENHTVVLGGTFFCSRSAGMVDRTDAQRIIPTLVILLARQVPEYARALAIELTKDRDLASKVISVQIEFMLLRPLRSVRATNKQIVFVIDALDECRDQARLAELINALADFRTIPRVKFLLTSRPEMHIRDTAITDRSLSSIIQLHMVDKSLVTNDIRLYIQRTLEKSSNNLKWYADEDIDDLAALSAGLFIFASTVLAYILRRKDVPGRSDRLRHIVELQASASTIATDPLDKMYSLVLMQASDPAAYEPTEIDEMRRIIAVILSTRSPLTIMALARLLEMSPGHLRGALDELHAVIFVPDRDEKGELRTLHASFGDFIFARAPEHIRIEKDLGHCELARACMKRMATSLRFNVSRSWSSWEENPRTKPHWIGHSLIYACLNWAHHIALSTSEPSFDDIFESVLQLKLLFWLEVLSVVGEVGCASEALCLAAEKVSSPDASRFFRDANSFVTSSRNAIERSAPHIYLSALAFAPKESLVYQTFYSHLTGIPRFETFRLSSISCERTPRVLDDTEDSSFDLGMNGHTGEVYGTAVGHHGRFIASASADGSVRVWDSQTRQQMYPPLVGHKGPVYSVALSSDNRWIVTGSQDRTVRLWKARTGHSAMPELCGHADVVNAVSFSPDDLHIASGSEDRTVRVWEVTGGRLAGIEQIECNEPVRTLAYSPNGELIAIGDHLGDIKIYDASTRQQVRVCRGPRDFQSYGILPRVRQLNFTSSLAFSPDGSRIVATLRTGLAVFEAHTGRRLMDIQGHHFEASAVAYSSDRQVIASGGNDWTVRLWNPETHEFLEPVLHGHVGVISSVVFSSNGRFLVTGSWDKTVRRWDLEKIRPLADERGRSPIASLAFANYEEQYSSQHSGWLVSSSGELLLWVPPEHRGHLEIGGHSRVISTHRVVVTAEDDVLHQGDQWTRCWST